MYVSIRICREPIPVAGGGVVIKINVAQNVLIFSFLGNFWKFDDSFEIGKSLFVAPTHNQPTN